MPHKNVSGSSNSDTTGYYSVKAVLTDKNYSKRRDTVMIAPQLPKATYRVRQLLLLVVRQFLAFSYYFSVYFKIL